MKTQIFKLLVIVLLITSYSCKTEPSIDYKFENNAKVLNCEFENSKLYNEAVHSFENDIIAFYDKEGKNRAKAYNGFLNNTLRNGLKIEQIASKHSLSIALALKKETKLWNTSTKETTLNYSHPLVDCIANNIKTQQLKQTFNSLLATNSMRKNVILPSLQGYSRSIPTDGSLISFLAFEYYYPLVSNLKAENLKTQVVNSKVDFNKTPQKQEIQPKVLEETKDPHAGHNHN